MLNNILKAAYNKGYVKSGKPINGRVPYFIKAETPFLWQKMISFAISLGAYLTIETD